MVLQKAPGNCLLALMDLKKTKGCCLQNDEHPSLSNYFSVCSMILLLA
jgi:hypothetical protein